MINKRVLGKNKEELARNFLVKEGYNIIEKNYRTRLGEIDIIAKDNDVICFIEVKYRRTDRCGLGVEAVDKRKQKIIVSVAKYYVADKKLSINDKYRFDVVSIDNNDISLYKGAFS